MDEGIDLHATIKALNKALAGESLDEEDTQVLYDLNQIMIETLQQLGSVEH